MPDMSPSPRACGAESSHLHARGLELPPPRAHGRARTRVHALGHGVGASTHPGPGVAAFMRSGPGAATLPTAPLRAHVGVFMPEAVPPAHGAPESSACTRRRVGHWRLHDVIFVFDVRRKLDVLLRASTALS